MKLNVKQFGEFPVRYRKGTSDEKVLEEVLERRVYRRARIGFDVESGERWLDLGANIGAFAVYCLQRKAIADCYEPDVSCFSLLCRNAPGCKRFNKAVTDSRKNKLDFYTSANLSRGTTKKIRGRTVCQVSNLWGGHLKNKKYSGVKLDIEGSEFGLIDSWLIPFCEKLCLEYHTSRDSSMENLGRRIRILQRHFSLVSYPPGFDALIAKGGDQKMYFDRSIFCMHPK